MVTPQKNNTAADSIARLLIFHCILGNQFMETAFDGPNEDNI